jgi:plastocyanin
VKAAIPLLALLVISSGYFINDAFAEISENQPFLLEGSGFAVTEESINFSEIDLGLSSRQQSGSTINFLVEDGFITISDKDFIISELEGKFLREGRYIRINGNVESSSGLDTPISFFGRLVEESKDGSVYGFTGRITTSDDTYKIIYTAKLSTLSQITPTSSTTSSTDSSSSIPTSSYVGTGVTTPLASDEITLYILKGSSTQGIKPDRITDDVYGTFRSSVQGGGATLSQAIAQQSADGHLKLRYFSQDRLVIEPGTTITIVNDDEASHSVVSGKENYRSRNTSDYTSTFTPDGRIVTESIPPGGSITITFDEMGFYRLYDPDYPWMKIVAYVFPPVPDSLVIKDYGNPKN